MAEAERGVLPWARLADRRAGGVYYLELAHAAPVSHRIVLIFSNLTLLTVTARPKSCSRYLLNS